VIQSALNALTSGRTWKEKVVLKGNFTISATIRIPSYTILEILGKLRLADGVNDVMIQNEDIVDVGNDHIEIRGGTLDGNKANNTPPTGTGVIDFRSVDYSIIDGAEIVDGGQKGIGWTRIGAGKDPIQNTISNCIVKNCNDAGIGIGYGWRFDIIANKVTKSYYGLYFFMCHLFNVIGGMYHENTKSGIYLDSLSTDNNFVGIVSQKNGEHGLVLTGTSNDNHIVGGDFMENTTDGLNMGDAKYCSVIGGTFRNNGGYGIDEFGGDYNRIMGNSVRANTAGQIRKVGVNTICRCNDGYVTENEGVATFSGDGTTTVFNIAHGLAGTPTKYGVSPLTPDADADRTITVDASNIVVSFSVAPPTGTDNVKFGWWAKI